MEEVEQVIRRTSNYRAEFMAGVSRIYLSQ